MYDAQQVMHSINHHVVGALALLMIAVAGMYLWFFASLRASARDRAYSFPMFCTLFWFAHDTSYVVRFHDWFFTYHYWFSELFWFALVLTSIFEVVFLRQTWRYGRSELAPGLSARAFGWGLAAAALCSVIIWAAVKHAFGEGHRLGDELYMYSFGLTVVVYPLAAISLMLRRGSAAGQSVPMWIGFCGVAVGYFSATTAFFGPAFQTWHWIAIGIVSVVGGIAGIMLIRAEESRGVLAANPLRKTAPQAPDTLDASLREPSRVATKA